MKTHLRVLLFITLVNYLAQVPYSLHQYHSLAPTVRGVVLLSLTFLLFAFSYVHMERGARSGFIGMIVFLTCEFVFYLLNFIGGVAAGYGWFFQLRYHDPVLFITFLIGYINLFASGYFLFYILAHRKDSMKGRTNA